MRQQYWPATLSLRSSTRMKPSACWLLSLIASVPTVTPSFLLFVGDEVDRRRIRLALRIGHLAGDLGAVGGKIWTPEQRQHRHLLDPDAIELGEQHLLLFEIVRGCDLFERLVDARKLRPGLVVLAVGAKILAVGHEAVRTS